MELVRLVYHRLGRSYPCHPGPVVHCQLRTRNKSEKTDKQMGAMGGGRRDSKLFLTDGEGDVVFEFRRAS